MPQEAWQPLLFSKLSLSYMQQDLWKTPFGLPHTLHLVQSHLGYYSRTTVGQPYPTVLGGYTDVVGGKPAWWLFTESHL